MSNFLYLIARQESSAGAVDEEIFIKSFEDINKIQVSLDFLSSKKFSHLMKCC